VRVSRGEFARLVRQLDEVTAALAGGTVRLEFSNGSAGQRHDSQAR
jgi:hypothetical protein